MASTFTILQQGKSLKNFAYMLETNNSQIQYSGNVEWEGMESAAIDYSDRVITVSCIKAEAEGNSSVKAYFNILVEKNDDLVFVLSQINSFITPINTLKNEFCVSHQQDAVINFTKDCLLPPNQHSNEIDLIAKFTPSEAPECITSFTFIITLIKGW